MSNVALDHVQFGVNNAGNLAAYYEKKFEMQPVAERKTETAEEYVLRLSDVTLSVAEGGSFKENVARHGDSVVDIALAVDDVDGVILRAREAGADILSEPDDIEDENGIVRVGAFAVFGDLRHTIVDRGRFDGAHLPGFRDDVAPDTSMEEPLFTRIDHFTVCIPRGEAAKWSEFYDEALGFSIVGAFGDHEKTDAPLGLATTIVGDKQHNVKLALTEPTPKKGGSQIDAFLAANQGSGVQHVALLTPSILRCVKRMSQNGVQFMDTPEVYYDELLSRVGDVDEDIRELQRLGVLVDREDDGTLLQIFTKSEHQPPTSFFEIIERRGADGFGEGNVRALAESVDRERM
jgi:4-hydroxyphenylpyruvate dioxygenase